MITPLPSGLQKTTNYKVVLPFYLYASISFIVATALLLVHTNLTKAHHFNPHTLAITHILARGWGTMIILGASHQLLPVLVDGKLISDVLAHLTFIFTAIGIPILVYAFYIFQTGWLMQIGAVCINVGIVCYVLNVFSSSFSTSKRNVHAWFIITASIWLFSTVFLGLLLVFNFTYMLLPKDSLSYLSIHAHLGIVGWFLLLVIGVGSRLIPMFLISKYTNDKNLWVIFWLINLGLISFLLIKFFGLNNHIFYFSVASILIAVCLFGIHCKRAYTVRIRRNVDEQMKTSLISIAQMLLPIIALIITLFFLPTNKFPNMILLYGFCIFFGWLTAIILGMTFKTLPFIVWNKVYHTKAQNSKTPAPKELFSETIYQFMLYSYLIGFIIFIIGIISLIDLILKIGAIALFTSAILYVYNTSKVIFHKPLKTI
ncbi:MAG: cytochrome c oxidase subunit I [Bacteroidia bacterium]|nr:cytochrome c oxidase subunit I [Bacteroidia bacterium]